MHVNDVVYGLEQCALPMFVVCECMFDGSVHPRTLEIVLKHIEQCYNIHIGLTPCRRSLACQELYGKAG
jgi:hypothetical protein